MSEPDLAFIRAEIDYDKGRPLDRKTIIPLFNEYILRICDIQNAFATRLESSFQALDTKLDRAETLLCLIEKRLERVSINNAPVVENEKPVDIPQVLIETKVDSEEINIEQNKAMMKIKDHPVYAKYFKMLKLGIPEQAVKIKMSSEGIDPAILIDPDKLIEAVEIPDSNSSSDSDSD